MGQWLPDEFIRRVTSEYPQHADELLHSLSNEAVTDRTLRCLQGYPPDEIEGYVPGEQVLWHPETTYFKRTSSEKNRPIHAYPGYQAGAWYVQEAAGLIVHHLLDRLKTEGAPMGMLLDACAAPGGKTLTLLDVLPEDGLLVASEPMEHRLPLLEATVARSGSDRVLMVQNPAQNWKGFPSYFDGILVDMPCSGEGMFRKHREAAKDWSLAKCASLVTLQDEILDSLYLALRPGGWLIYSTCTFGKEENTGQLLPWIRSGRLQPELWNLPEEWGWVHASEMDQRWDPKHGAWWSLPGRTQGEGFFCSVLRKPFDTETTHNTHSGNPQNRQSLAEGLKKQMRLIKNGLSSVPSDFPSPDLAMAYGKKHGRYPRNGTWSVEEGCPVVDLDATLATWYCQGQNLALGELRNGWNLMTYQRMGLGWMHREGTRFQNHFPKSLRIAR